MIAVNTGFGDDYSAAQEVEYVNGSEETIGGSWRTETGHDDPYDVKYWCVGNEMFGNWQLGHLPLKQYVQKHNLVAEAMRKVDPELVLVGRAILARRIVSAMAKMPAMSVGRKECSKSARTTWISSPSIFMWPGALDARQERSHSISTSGCIREQIRKKAASHRELQAKLGRKPDKFIPIAMDEWNYWHRDYVYGELGCQYDLADCARRRRGTARVFSQFRHHPDGRVRPDGERHRLHQDDQDSRLFRHDGPALAPVSPRIRQVAADCDR